MRAKQEHCIKAVAGTAIQRTAAQAGPVDLDSAARWEMKAEVSQAAENQSIGSQVVYPELIPGQALIPSE